MDNLRAAIDWSLAVSKPALSVQIIRSIWSGLLASGFANETLGWIDRILVQEKNLESEELARMWRLAGVCNYQVHRFDTAQRYYEQALQWCRANGDKLGEAANINNLAVVASEVLGDHERALALYEQARALYHELGHRQGMGHTLGNLGEASAHLGRYEDALAYHERAMRMFAENSSYPDQAWIKGCIGGVLYRTGDYDGAHRAMLEAAAILRDFGMVFPGWQEWFLKMSLLAAAEGKYARAAQLQGIVDTIQDEGVLLEGQDLKSHRALKEQLEARLGEEAYRVEWERGRMMPAEQAIEFGMKDVNITT